MNILSGVQKVLLKKVAIVPTLLIAMNDYLSIFKSYEFLNCTMFIYSNPTTPSTLNPDLIFHFYCGFDQTLGLAFNFDFGTDLDFDFNFKFQFHILTFQQDLAHI